MSSDRVADERGHDMTCPDDDALARFLQGDTLDTAAATADTAKLASHVERCALCRAALSALSGKKSRTRAADGTLPPGARIGRFVVEGQLGAGGMGVVYRARDDELARPVALKLLFDGGAGSSGRERLLQEAKAMAALQHPNVVTLFDFGTHAGSVYLAMEVAGQNLRTWLAAAPRSRAAIVDAFVQAARGLAAAHALGIVHRDFKPDNVFVGDDGRVRVGDFGLARAAPVATVPDGADTHATAVAGTVRYMAPEQLAGKRAEPRSDQFAFCVALCEALTGALPFGDGDNLAIALRAAYADGAAPALPAKLPRHLVRVLARGLRLEPAARFPAMTDVIAALTVAPARRRRTLIAGAVVAAVAASSGAAYVLGREPAAPAIAPCDGGRALAAAAWNPAAVRARFATGSSGNLHDLGERVVAQVEDYTDRWAAMHHATCSATLVEGRQSPELMDLRMGCLDDRLREVGALGRELAGATDAQLQLAMDATGKLGKLAACADDAALRSRTAIAPPSPTLQATIAIVDAQVLAAKFAESTSAYDRSLAIASEALAIAARTGYAPVEAKAQYYVGQALSRLERGAEASEHLQRSATAADASHSDEVAASARIALVFSLGMREGKYAEAERMADFADASIRRLGGSPEREAELLITRAAILNRVDQPDKALPLSRQALAILEAQVPPDRIQLARTYNRIGNDTTNLAHHAEALPYYAKALAIFEHDLGPSHPQVATVLTNRGGALRFLGRYDDAIADQQRAVAIREQVFGADHPEVAAAISNLANTFNAKGDAVRAYELRKRAVAIAEAKLPPTHNNLLLMRLNALDSMIQLDTPAALALCDRVLPGEERDRGERPTTARFEATCAVAYLRVGRAARAWELYRAGVAIIDRTQNVLSEPYLQPFVEELVHVGRGREALPYLERLAAHARANPGDTNLDREALDKLVAQAKRASR